MKSNKILLMRLSKIEFDIAEIISMLKLQLSNKIDNNKSIFLSKYISRRIYCRISIDEIMTLLRQMENKTLINMGSNGIRSTIDFHFEFENESEKSNPKDSQYDNIKIVWLHSQRLLIYFVEQLCEKEVISIPQNYKLSRLIVDHFCDKNKNNFKIKDISDQKRKTKFNKKIKIRDVGKPDGFEIIDTLLEPLSRSNIYHS